MDEAIHITSSFLLAGFPTAVGTLWKIDSTHADHMTRGFYRRTTAPDSPGVARPARHRSSVAALYLGEAARLGGVRPRGGVGTPGRNRGRGVRCGFISRRQTRSVTSS
ncbi:CHAT domain-containing protein [Streptomyces sp. NPDC002540]